MTIHNDIDQFIGLKPALYQFLKTVHFTREINLQGCLNYDVEIILSKIANGKIEDLKVRCTNVVDIKIGEIDSMFGMLLDIEDVSNDHHEGISYRISEQENNTFSFSCGDFYVELIG